MRYTLTHACGHAGTVTLYGPGTERDRKLAWLASRPCRDCLTNTTHERALTQADTRELPTLTGSPKQVEWAVRCRYHALLLLDRVLAGAEQKPERVPIPEEMRLPGESDPSLGDLIARLSRQDAARFWIDHGKHADRAWQPQYLDSAREPVPGPTEQVATLLFAAAGVGQGTQHPEHAHPVLLVARISHAVPPR